MLKTVTVKQLRNFIMLFALLAAYTIYMSIKYDFSTTGVSSLIIWSFFVLCTPVADAGLLLDLPLRLLFGIRMFVAEIYVWAIAILINLVSVFLGPQYYSKTVLTEVFYKILTTPNPYWIIIVLSGIGTFLSLLFGDELLDFIYNKNIREFYASKGHVYATIALLIIFTIVIYSYYTLISAMKLGI